MNTNELPNRKVLYKWEHIIFMEQDVLKNNKIIKYELVVRNNINWIIAVLPITEDKKVVLIKQFRIPVNDTVLEVSAWLCDKEWEDEIDTVKRELLEETWYTSDEISYAYTTAWSPWITSEKVNCYIALNAKKASYKQNLDEIEQIEVVEIPLDEINDFILENTVSWAIIDSKVLALLYFYFEIILKGKK